MRNHIIMLTGILALPLAACGGSSNTEPLSEEDLQSRQPVASVDFGSDDGDWSNDDECDDPRFRGPGMTTTPLLEEDEKADATDCRTAYERGELMLIE